MPALWQPSSLVPRDAEKVLIAAMRPKLAGVAVNRVVPKAGAGSTGKLIVFTRDGGAFDGLIDRARMRVRCLADDAEDANALANDTIRLMASLVGSTATYVEHLSGPIDATDKGERQQRYLLFEVHLRGVPAST